MIRKCRDKCLARNLQYDLADRRVAHTMDPISYHHPSQERQPTTLQELPHNQPYMPPK